MLNRENNEWLKLNKIWNKRCSFGWSSSENNQMPRNSWQLSCLRDCHVTVPIFLGMASLSWSCYKYVLLSTMTCRYLLVFLSNGDCLKHKCFATTKSINQSKLQSFNCPHKTANNNYALFCAYDIESKRAVIICNYQLASLTELHYWKQVYDLACVMISEHSPTSKPWANRLWQDSIIIHIFGGSRDLDSHSCY